MSQQQVEIFIDELVLHDFAPEERYQIGAAVEMELNRLFIENGLPNSFQQPGSMPLLKAGSFQFNRNDKTVSAGSQIAGSVYSALTSTGIEK